MCFSRDMVGSDNILSMPLPTEMHLPLTELEKQAEELEYCELLDKVHSISNTLDDKVNDNEDFVLG